MITSNQEKFLIVQLQEATIIIQMWHAWLWLMAILAYIPDIWQINEQGFYQYLIHKQAQSTDPFWRLIAILLQLLIFLQILGLAKNLCVMMLYHGQLLQWISYTPKRVRTVNSMISYWIKCVAVMIMPVLLWVHFEFCARKQQHEIMIQFYHRMSIEEQHVAYLLFRICYLSLSTMILPIIISVLEILFAHLMNLAHARSVIVPSAIN